MNFILDTNVVIYLQKGLLAEPLPHGSAAISIITEIELRGFPGLLVEQTLWLGRFLASIHSLGITSDIKESTIRLRRAHRLKIPDAIIAATTLTHGAVLLTNDEQLHAVPGLTSRPLALKKP